ncbi:MAG: polysaccharide biosynthesis/export family protein [Paludibacteraceae bacterium]|nr:polysaccharide biosynthesis/export family protein [Paludibacteraceae bacterium]
MKALKHIYLVWLALLLAAVSFTGCYPHRAVGLLQDRDKLPHYDSVPYQPYRLHVNDEIVYRVITLDETLAKTLAVNNSSANNNSSQYAYTYRIYSDGTVDLPFLPPIHLEGLTELEAQDTVKKYMRELIPDAEIKLALYNKQFTVLGDISSGVKYIYKERMTIYQALAMTGDLMKSADRKHVRIIRPHGNGEPEILEFDIRTNTLIDSKYYYIYPNDLIYVSREKASFFKQETYPAFLGLITSSVALLITVLNYIPGAH